MDAALGGKCVLITGANGGIGLATARAFAEEGANLILHYRQQRDALDTLLADLRDHSPNAETLAVQADLRDEAQTDAMYEQALRAFPMIDTVIVNAGIWDASPVPLDRMTTEQWHRTMASNLDSAFFTCRGFLRHLADGLQERASIVLVASTAAIFGEADHADYAASKAAMAYGLTRSLKNEIVRHASHARVNCVCPGWTNTPMAADQITDTELLRHATATRPIREIAKPEDIASAIVFLSSDTLAGHISGAILPIAGGMEGRLLHP